MSTVIETIEYKGYEIEIHRDEDPESPRDWDNVSLMICFHKKYTLGDEHDYQHDNFDGWDAVEAQLREDYEVEALLPLYLYDHSGITMNTTGFSCGWDSGQVGFVIATKKLVTMCCGDDPKYHEEKWLEEQLVEDIKLYSQFHRGDVVGYTTNTPDESSCWGYYSEEDAISDAKSGIDFQAKKDQLKMYWNSMEFVGMFA